MENSIIITSELHRNDTAIISIEQYRKKRQRRRRRQALRMAKRFPLFAIEFMQDEFPDYQHEQWEADIVRPKRKRSKRLGKSPLKRQGRYPLMQKALIDYHLTKNIDSLYNAQQLRRKMFCPFELVFMLEGKRRHQFFPSTTSVQLIKDLAKIKFNSWEQLDEILKDRLKYSHIS